MLIKLTVFGLCILLVFVVTATLYANIEGFANAPTPTLTQLLGKVSEKKPDSKPASASAPALAPTNVPTSEPANVPSINVPSITVQSLKLSEPAPFSAPIKALDKASSPSPTRTEVKPEVSVSDTGYNAIALQQKSDLLKDIQKLFRNELLASRATQQVPTNGASSQTHATSQGIEMNGHKKQNMQNVQNGSMHHSDMNIGVQGVMKDMKGPMKGVMNNASMQNGCDSNDSSNSNDACDTDMSQYIKKDAIPCWGCSLDY